MIECCECAADLPPHLNRCLNCGGQTDEVYVQVNPFWWTEKQVKQITKGAQDDSVTYDALTDHSEGMTEIGLQRRPLIGYLWEGESPLFILESAGNPVEIISEASNQGWEIEQSSNFRAKLVVSDERILFSFPTASHSYDGLISIPYDCVKSASLASEKDAPSGAHAINIETRTTEFILPVTVSESKDRLNKITELIDNGVNALPTDREQQDQLLTLAAAVMTSNSSAEADNIVSESVTAHDAIVQITEQLREEWEESLDDEAVKRANSFSDLLSEEESLPANSPRAGRSGHSSGDIAKIGAGGAAGAGIAATLRAAFENADLTEVATAGVEIGREGLPIAVAAPWSTPLVLGALVATGATTELYKSANDGTVVDNIEPGEIVRRAKSGSKAGDEYDIGKYDGRKVGATLSAVRYLAENLTPEEYLDTVMESNPELMLEGAEIGVELSNKADTPVGEGVAATTGMAVGLKKSYENGTTSLSEGDLREVLDDDLYHQYVEARNLIRRK